MSLAPGAGASAEDILAFWFSEGLATARPIWFQRDEAFDAAIRQRFGAATEAAREGALDDWAATPRGALALVILLDQFPRNLFRGTARAFAADARARAVARQAVLAARHDLALPPAARIFLYLPFEHGEAASDQDLSVTLFEGLRDHPPARAPGGSIDYAWRHWQVIRRFGRFPHRNAALLRRSSAAEEAFLTLPDSRF
jgi:uncharacterized protein (DUF924 family)